MTLEKSERIAKIMRRSRARMDSSKANEKSSRYQRVSGEEEIGPLSEKQNFLNLEIVMRKRTE